MLNRRFHDALRTAGIKEPVTEPSRLAAMQERLARMSRELEHGVLDGEQKRDEHVIERGEANRTLKEDERELEALQQRQGNLPESFAELRRQLCDDLRLTEKDLPFVAELVAVKPDERTWEASIESVLHGFALSLLVPRRHYHVVSRHVDRTRLADSRGRGQRLVYLRVGERASPTQAAPALHEHSLLRKLLFRDGHSLLPWVKGELEERFDFRCCDTIEEFQAAHAADGTLSLHAQSFAELENSFAERPLTVVNCFESEQAFVAARHTEVERLRQELEPLKAELCKAMLRYLREFPDEQADLNADAAYLDSFLDRREHIRREDLPRHEQRFKDRLNEKVTHELGVLNGALQSDRSEIISRIDQLNLALRELQYRAGTFMRLEPRPVRDREIAEFQDALKECLAETFEDTSEAEEARYQRIAKLIARLVRISDGRKK